ncbi:hypothetical protein OIU76_012023 [Salix suchowensis]|nr:hypothetical protein OIU76_012023 [Salix suchowensis]
MEVSSSASPRMSLDQLQNKGSEETHLQNFELESSDFSDRHNHQFHSMSALEILRETVRILRSACSAFSAIGFGQELNLYAAMIAGLAFSVVFANAIIICNTAVVVCVLEDVSGLQALLRSRVLIRGQTQVGLLIFLGSAIGMAMIQGLFEHRVKTLSYGDGSSRIWEGPLLVVMHSFVALIDLMMSAVFYYSCRSYSMETSDGECQSILGTATVSAESVGTP